MLLIQPYNFSCPKAAREALQINKEHKHIVWSVSALCNTIACVFQREAKLITKTWEYIWKWTSNEKLVLCNWDGTLSLQSKGISCMPVCWKKSVSYFSKRSTMLSKLGDYDYMYTAHSETKWKLMMTVQAHTTLNLLMI